MPHPPASLARLQRYPSRSARERRGGGAAAARGRLCSPASFSRPVQSVGHHDLPNHWAAPLHTAVESGCVMAVGWNWGRPPGCGVWGWGWIFLGSQRGFKQHAAGRPAATSIHASIDRAINRWRRRGTAAAQHIESATGRGDRLNRGGQKRRRQAGRHRGTGTDDGGQGAGEGRAGHEAAARRMDPQASWGQADAAAMPPAG